MRACVLAEEAIGNRYLELIYRTDRNEQRTKVCLFHRSPVTHRIVGHIGSDANIQESRRDRVGMPMPIAPRGARLGTQASATSGASAGPVASAPSGASVWRPKLCEEIPEEENAKDKAAVVEGKFRLMLLNSICFCSFSFCCCELSCNLKLF